MSDPRDKTDEKAVGLRQVVGSVLIIALSLMWYPLFGGKLFADRERSTSWELVLFTCGAVFFTVALTRLPGKLAYGCASAYGVVLALIALLAWAWH